MTCELKQFPRMRLNSAIGHGPKRGLVGILALGGEDSAGIVTEKFTLEYVAPWPLSGLGSECALPKVEGQSVPTVDEQRWDVCW